VPATIEIAGHQVAVSHQDKVLFPADGLTKGDVVGYYRAVADVLLPHVADRPLNLRRFPDGIDHQGFFQQHAGDHVPDWVATVEDSVVGMMVLHGGELGQLYLDPPWRGSGIGDRLVKLAKKRCPTGLALWTFQVNGPAQRFYERHGFVAVERTDGRGNEEHEPDIRFIWRPEN